MNRLIYLPLGGAGEIGMNAYVYGYGAPGSERLIVVDLGVTFPSMDGQPGVDLIMPDIAWLEARADRVEAIFITHAHEDHIGALGLLRGRLRDVPIYTRAFTGAVARAKLDDHGHDIDAVQVLDTWPDTVKAGPFEVGFLPVPHSIPEASGMIIDTPLGRLVHTGDFKLDPDPVVGEGYSPAAWSAVARGGIKALICDSTNVFSPHPGRSEASLRDDIAALVKAQKGMMVATTFASNIARLKTLAQAGVDAGRSVVLLGRAMKRMTGYAHFAGLIDDFPPTVDVEDAQDIPREHLMLIVTGSQGERRAASGQLANGKYLGFEMRDGDSFLFSSKTIPGNEVGVARIMNAFSEMGVHVFDDSSGNVHVSGHANRPDLQEAHRVFDPEMVIPMHGEHRHLRAHAALAAEAGRGTVIAPNGTMVDLTGDAPEIVDHIEAGRTYLDGDVLIGAYDGIVLDRIRMATRGLVVANVVLEKNRIAGESWVEVVGLPDTGPTQKSLQEQLETAIDAALETAKPNALREDEDVEDLVGRTISRTCRDLIGKKPVNRVFTNRLQ